MLACAAAAARRRWRRIACAEENNRRTIEGGREKERRRHSRRKKRQGALGRNSGRAASVSYCCRRQPPLLPCSSSLCLLSSAQFCPGLHQPCLQLSQPACPHWANKAMFRSTSMFFSILLVCLLLVLFITHLVAQKLHTPIFCFLAIFRTEFIKMARFSCLI